MLDGYDTVPGPGLIQINRRSRIGEEAVYPAPSGQRGGRDCMPTKPLKYPVIHLNSRRSSLLPFATFAVSLPLPPLFTNL